MSEMVERLAKAIFLSQYDSDLSGNQEPPEAFWPDRLSYLVSGPPFEADGYRDMARAAIEAMREPTDEMVSAVDSDWGPQLSDNWRDMIDAAIGKVDA